LVDFLIIYLKLPPDWIYGESNFGLPYADIY